MKAREFCYWLQVHLELAATGAPIDPSQLGVIGRHSRMPPPHRARTQPREPAAIPGLAPILAPR